jgi:3-dehydroquinate dehydratase
MIDLMETTMDTETLDKLYLEWSNFTKARTRREYLLLATCRKISECGSLDDAKALAMNALRSLGESFR